MIAKNYTMGFILALGVFLILWWLTSGAGLTISAIGSLIPALVVFFVYPEV